MIPYTALRMGGNNALGIAPIPNNNDMLNEFFYRVLPMLQGEEGRKAVINQRMMDTMRARQLQDAKDARANPNVVYNPNVNGIKPIDAANLNLKAAAEQGKNERAADANATRQDIAGSNNQVKSTIAGNALAERAQFGQTENAIRSRMADIAQFRANHPEAQFYAPAGGTLHYFDRNAGQMVDTGIDTGKMTDEDKANLGLSNTLSEIAARGGQQRQTNAAAIAARGAQQRQTNAAKVTQPKVQSNSDKRAEYFNNAQQVANDPQYKDSKGNPYVTMGDAGKFTVDPNTPQDIYHTINEKIYNPGGSADHQDVNLPSDHPDPLQILNQDQSQDQGQ